MGPGLTTGVLVLLTIIAQAKAASFSVFCDAERGFEVEQGESDTIWSYRSSSTSNVTWTVRSPDGKVIELGSCRGKTCSSPLAPDIVIDPRVYSPSKSDLDIVSMKREYAGELIFTETYDGVEETANCTLNAYTSAIVDNCGVTAHRSNWSVIGYCDVTQAFSAVGNYEFSVTIFLETPEFRAKTRMLGRQPFTPAPYTNPVNGREYVREKLVYSFELPKYDGNYTTQTNIYPGTGVSRSEELVPVETPARPAHDCQNLTFIPENGEVPCVCSTESAGTPEGRLIWFSGDTVLAAGDYGVTHLQFPSDKVDRQHDGKDIRCQLDWIVKRNVSLTNSVAYGPDSVEIVQYTVTEDHGARSVIITCSVTEVNPLTPDMIHWGGLCQGQAGFTCTVSMATLDENEAEVTCTAVNTENNGHSASVKVKLLDVTRSTTEQPASKSNAPSSTVADTSSGLMRGVAIGGGAALGVLAAVVVVVLLVLWRRGCLSGCRSVCDAGKTKKEEEVGQTPTDITMEEIPQPSNPVA